MAEYEREVVLLSENGDVIGRTNAKAVKINGQWEWTVTLPDWLGKRFTLGELMPMVVKTK